MPKSEYFLGRLGEESARLDRQHDLLCKMNGFVLHPSIAASLPTNAKIADVATGTGVFLLRLPATYGSSTDFWQLDGFDISDAQLPPADVAPKNVHFYKHDTRDVFPSQYVGQYDVVHIRLMILALKHEEWYSTARNALQLLKPGQGRLQWTEALTFPSPECIKGPLGSNKSNLETIMTKFGKIGGKERFESAKTQFSKVLPELGLQNLQIEIHRTDENEDLRKAWTQNLVGAAMSAIKLETSKNAGGSWSEQEIEERYRKACEEIDDGNYAVIDFGTYFGKVH